MPLFRVTYTVTSPGHSPATCEAEVEAPTSPDARAQVKADLEAQGLTVTYMVSKPAPENVPNDVPAPNPAPKPADVPNDVPKKGAKTPGKTAYSTLTKAQKEKYQAQDVRRRVLVGARLDRDKAELVREAARASGRSVYRFVADAIEHELERFSAEMYAAYTLDRLEQGGYTDE